MTDSDGWQIRRPDRPLTDAHLMITGPGDRWDPASARSLIDSYRTARTALHRLLGCTGFAISFRVGWQPYGDAIGEPDEPATGCAVHVFGRRDGESVSPVRAMLVPRPRRLIAEQSVGLDAAVELARSGEPFLVPPVPFEGECDGCAESVRTEQELWRDDRSRVIRPKQPMIDAQVLVLPLRHVVSLGDLGPEELISLAGQLERVREQFARRHTRTGLSCFANDGSRAGQSTPHVHIHCYGRAVDEDVQPFEELARRLGIQSAGPAMDAGTRLP